MIYSGSCHCGAVKFEIDAPEDVEVEDCNCSICNRTGFLHLILPLSKFKLLQGQDNLTTYQFNSGVAKHTFAEPAGSNHSIPRAPIPMVSISMCAVSTLALNTCGLLNSMARTGSKTPTPWPIRARMLKTHRACVARYSLGEQPCQLLNALVKLDGSA